ncbi:hypothetical protein ABE187_10300 [Bacillus cabrialesii]|uniref:Uncharacterized protein n=1 Tax=Bacillus cabrialesii subsp. tritici TaxID=2944916 RepID=A0ABT9DFR7_9BACI|nr:hypothetical protein [Bacillus cabrialesii]AUZ25056.1 hypothetical protein C1T25_01625 [Bacillus cereus]MDO8223519.1 hypothetical protein [Bacillus cabrialesii subsp. tritici]POO74078.1 hypothetical protein C1T28_12070 [Bacillus subtilis]
MISICLKNSSKRSSTSQAALVTDTADTGITAAAGADITEAIAAAQAKEDTTTVMAGVIVTNAGATAAVNPKKVLVPLLGQGFFYVTD